MYKPNHFGTCQECGTPLTGLYRCPTCTRIEYCTKSKRFIIFDKKTGAVLQRGDNTVGSLRKNDGYPAFTNQPEAPKDDGPETWYSDIWD